MKDYRAQYNKYKKYIYWGILAAALICTLLMVVSNATRAALVGFFGWAICAYIPIAVVSSILLLRGRKLSISKGRLAIIIALFVMIICTLHIHLTGVGENDLFHSDKSYILAPVQGVETVGGMLVAILVTPIKLLVKDYGVFLVIYFIATAILGLAALYPFIAEIKDPARKHRKEEKAIAPTISLNPIPPTTEKTDGLNVDNVEPSLSERTPLIDNADAYCAPTAFLPKEPYDKRRLFVDIIGEEDAHAEKGQRSADILFSNEPIKPKKQEKQPEDRFGYLTENLPNSSTNYYTNQGRQRMFEENMRKTFGERSAEEEYNSRYGDMPDYGTSLKHQETTAAVYSEKNDVQIIEPRVVEPVQSYRAEEVTPFRAEPIQAYRAEPKTENSAEVDISAHSKLFDIAPIIKDEKPIVAEKPAGGRIINAKDYINTPLRPEEYQNIDLVRPIKSDTARVESTVVSTIAPSKPKIVDGAIQKNVFGDEAKKPMPVRLKPYVAPSIELLTNYPYNASDFPSDYEEVKKRIEEALAENGIEGEVFNAKRGPTFTRYEIKLGPGLSVSKVETAKKNFLMRLRTTNLRIIAPFRGKDAIGFELPNEKREKVGLRSILSTSEYATKKGGVWVAFGKTLEGTPYVANLAKMPHLLVAGSTGTGKSVFINSLITSILYKYSPEDVRLLLIDPKRVELSVYQNLPHLLIKDTIKEPQHAVNLLEWLTKEMDNRFKFLEKYGCNEIDLYNDSIRDKATEPKMPRIVLFIDEMADLMIKGKGQVETYIVRIAQLGRACGIHLVLATQRPTVNVITGLIKSNILSRVAFTVKTNQDSRIILDEGGAESLLGNGDMLYSSRNDLERIQGAMVDIMDIKKICDFIKAHNEGVFDEEIAKAVICDPEEEEEKSAQIRKEERAQERDEDFEKTLKRILRTFILEKRASVSSAQAKHNVGYIRAKKLVDAMAERGYISKDDGSAKPREVLITMEEFRQIYGED